MSDLTREQKQSLIRQAYDYNADKRAMASCNALYMGSMATAMLVGALGGEYGRDSLDKLIDNATDEQLDAGLVRCENIITHGKLQARIP